MTLPWSAAQVEWLQAMGLEVLRDARATAPSTAASAAPLTGAAASGEVPPGLRRAARGIDLGPLLAAHGVPFDVASRRAFWRALRPLRRAARTG